MRIRAALIALSILTSAAAPSSAVKLWRLDCGTFTAKGLTNSCYLIRRGATYMLWDAGFSASDPSRATILSQRLTEQLAAQFAADEVPRSAEDAATMRQSFRRFRAIAASEHARIVIQHEPRVVAALPKFPQGAE